MPTYNFDVDTSPMARSIDGVNTNVIAVGAAVTAMEAAVIASERAATKKICESVDQGFFLLLRSRISQKIAQFASTMNSRTGSMMETASSIDRTHHQMLEDFNRIKSRYLKLFDGLDRNLEQRIRELDRPSMELAKSRADFLSTRQCREIPSTLFYTSDNASVALKISNARVKSKAQDTIGALSEGTSLIRKYEQTCESIFEEGSYRDSGFEYLPVVYAVTESQTSSGSFYLEVSTPTVLDAETQSEMATGVRRGQGQLLGSDKGDMNAVRASYVEKVTAAGLDPRVTKSMIELFDSSFATNDPASGYRDPAGQDYRM